MEGFRSIGNWRGIPVAVHWTVLLSLPWAYYQTKSVYDSVLICLAYFTLIGAHEAGHALVARLRNTGVAEIRLYLFHGQCVHDAPYSEADDVFIAWGGVLAQFALLGAALIIQGGLQAYAPAAMPWAKPVLWVFISVNIATAILNLIPVPPLDGARAWRVIALAREQIRAKYQPLLQRRRANKERGLQIKSKKLADEIIGRLREKE